MNSETNTAIQSTLNNDIYESIRLGDELVGREVSEDIMTKAYEWLFYFANKLGVEREDIAYSFIVRELLAMYAYREVCIKKGYGAIGTPYRGQNEGDHYTNKSKTYDARIKQLESKLTAEDLTGDNTSGKRSNYRTIQLFRG